MRNSRAFKWACTMRDLAIVTLTPKAIKDQVCGDAHHAVGFLQRFDNGYVTITDTLGADECGPMLKLAHIEAWHILPVTLSDEDKERMDPYLHRTWQGIGPDAQQFVSSVSDIVELVCDADRPCDYGMSRVDYKLLCRAYNHADTQAWLHKVLNYA